MGQWTLRRFLHQLDRWATEESPDLDLKLTVTAWILSRADDPYQGVRREPDFENLWFGPVPATRHGRNQVVCCSYRIIERDRTVVCDSFATLSLPV